MPQTVDNTAPTADNTAAATPTVPTPRNNNQAVVTVFDRVAFIQEYNETGSPKQRKIPCTVTGEMITIFGANLKKRIEKYGGVEALLDGFVSRKAVKKNPTATTQPDNTPA